MFASEHVYLTNQSNIINENNSFADGTISFTTCGHYFNSFFFYSFMSNSLRLQKYIVYVL